MMKLKRDLQSVVKDLKSLTKTTEKMMKRIKKLEKAQITKKKKAKTMTKAKSAKRRAVKKPKKATAIDTVLYIIKNNRSKKGVGTAALKKKTGFNDRKIFNTINSLKRQGKIKGAQRGFYVKA